MPARHAEARHGNLCMIERRDLAITILKSGESPEFPDTLADCRRFGIVAIVIAVAPNSSHAKAPNQVLLLPALRDEQRSIWVRWHR